MTVLRWKTMDRPQTSGPWVNGPVEVVLASEYDKMRAELEWLRAWRMKDPETVDFAIAYALGEVDEEGNEINTPKKEPMNTTMGLAQPASAARPLDDWHDDLGDVLWWRFPVDEPPYVGSPLDVDWPGYHTHWTPLPPIPRLADQPSEGAKP